jgi:hypothetical protein
MLTAFKKERFLALVGEIAAAEPKEQIASLGRVFNQSQDNADAALRAIMACPLIDGRIVTVEFSFVSASATATVEVPHGLGRKPLGWFRVRDRYAAFALYGIAIMDKQDTNTHPEKTLILYAAGTGGTAFTEGGGTVSEDIYIF